MRYILLFVLLPTLSFGQDIPPSANTIIIKGLSYNEICTALLDAGYGIEKKDAEMQTVRTEPIKYPRYYNGAYKINVRLKDSIAYMTGIYQCPYETQFASLLVGQTIQANPWDNKDIIYNRTNKKGETQSKSMQAYPFLLMNEFAKSLGKEIEYSRK